jgi:peptidyl-prolyl cis-trans isomerase C
MRKILYALTCFTCFAGGAWVWKVKSIGLQTPPPLREAPAEAPKAAAPELVPSAVVVDVGGERITQEDVDWEYGLATAGVFDKETLTPIPDLGARYHQELSGLKRSLVGSVLERKLLFAYVKQDHEFQFDDPSRYSACLTDWQHSMEQPLPELQGKGRDRLKARLCERSILDQYLKERLFAGIKVEEVQVVEYYKNHVSEFRLPERVAVRQVLLATEQEAKKCRYQINARNFAEYAKAHSIAPEAEKGGKLGPFAKGAMPAVFDVAFKMRKGEISDVIKSNYGYHVMMVLEKFPKTELGLDQARAKIVQALTKQREEEAYSRWVEKALATINVTSPKPVW